MPPHLKNGQFQCGHIRFHRQKRNRLSAQLSRDRKKNYVAAYVDASKWGQWIQKELYAWTFPTLIVQRHVGIGERYFFKWGGQLPETTEVLVDFVKKADKYKLDARRKSQRPQLLAANEDWKQLVGDNIESELRSSPATLVDAFKVDTGIDDSAEDVAEEEKELFRHRPPSEIRCQGEKSRPQDQCSDPRRCCRREGTSVAE